MVRERRQYKGTVIVMNTKRIPAIVMLLGGAVACIVTFINHYNLKDMLVVVTLSLVFFLILGVIIRLVLDSFELPEDVEVVDDEGEVIEKQVEDDGQLEDEGENFEGEEGTF